jgi:glutamine synthetase
MDARLEGVATVEELGRALDLHGIRRFKMAAFDVDGILRGKYVERSKFLASAEKGFGFCDVVLGWDSADTLVDGLSVAGWHTGYRDAPVSLDLSTLRKVPFEPDTALLLGSFTGDYAAVCPRTVLSKVVERARGMGLEPWGSLEYEVFVFDETPHSVRAKSYRDLKPFTPGMFGYSMLRSGVHAELYHELLSTMEELRCPIEGLHTETGPGVIEAALRYDHVLEAADRAGLFKTFTKILAQRRGLMATFMAKWNAAYPGQSGHIHLSLTDAASGESAFFDPVGKHGMSPRMRAFVAGQVKYMPEVLAMVCSTINAYRRLVPGMWAPTRVSWGVENRTTALRVVPGGPKSQRRRSRRACAASKRGSSSAPWSRATPTRRTSRCPRCPPRSRPRRRSSPTRRRPARCSATASSTISSRRAGGRCGSSRSTSRTGISRATSRSSDHAVAGHGQPKGRAPEKTRRARRRRRAPGR